MSDPFFDSFRQRQHRTEMDADIREASNAARAGADHAAHLQETVDRLTLACHAMWSLLVERAGFTEKDLLSKIVEIDLKDGTLDGRLAKKPKICPACKRTNAPRRVWCLYCNAPMSNTAF